MKEVEKADWDATWEGNRRSQLDTSLAATPAERLAWLEEALELAYQAGALPIQFPQNRASLGN